MKSAKIKGIEHFVYETEQEFRMYHNEPIVTPWQKADIGDWVLADDGGIVEILRSGPKNKLRYVGTIVGTFLCDGKQKMDTNFDKHPYRYTFTGIESRHLNLNRKLSQKERAFYVFLSMGDSPETALGKVYDIHDGNYKKFKIKYLLSKPAGIEMVTKLAEKAAQEAGVSLTDIMKRMNKRGEQTTDLKTAQKADETLGKWLGVEEQSVPVAPYMIMGQEVVRELYDAEHHKLVKGTGENEIHGRSNDKLLPGEPQYQSEVTQSEEG